MLAEKDLCIFFVSVYYWLGLFEVSVKDNSTL